MLSRFLDTPNSGEKQRRNTSPRPKRGNLLSTPLSYPTKCHYCCEPCRQVLFRRRVFRCAKLFVGVYGMVPYHSFLGKDTLIISVVGVGILWFAERRQNMEKLP